LTIAAPLPTGAGEIAASAAVARPKASDADMINVLIMMCVPSCAQTNPRPAPQLLEIGATRRDVSAGERQNHAPENRRPQFHVATGSPFLASQNNRRRPATFPARTPLGRHFAAKAPQLFIGQSFTLGHCRGGSRPPPARAAVG